MKIAAGSDHAGFRLKQHLVEFCRANGHEVVDLGPQTDERSDYPDFASRVAEAVASGTVDRGLLVCGSGIGVAMTANRFRGVRAVPAVMESQARLARQHNDANVVCLGQRLTAAELAESIVAVFLTTPFEGGRHQARVEKLERFGSGD